jgi:DNA polymerase III subunit epsilon
MIKLERPIVFVDFETTGVDTSKDRIIEYAFCKINPDGSRETKEGKLNPGIPIPPSATEIHGISDEDVKDKPAFKNFAKGILAFIEGCDLGGFNSNNFDFPLLYAEFNRCGINWDYSKQEMVDCGNIFKIKEERTLAAAVKFFLGKELEGAHGALADIIATADVFEAQLLKYEDLPKTIPELSLFSNFGKKRLDMANKFVLAEDGKTVIINFGKSKGYPAQNDKGFLQWMLSKDFPPDTLKIAEEQFWAKD